MPNRDAFRFRIQGCAGGNGYPAMSQVLPQYKALSTSASRDQASETFAAILVGMLLLSPGYRPRHSDQLLALTAKQLDVESRKTLTQLILDDLRAALIDNTISRLSKDGSFFSPLTVCIPTHRRHRCTSSLYHPQKPRRHTGSSRHPWHIIKSSLPVEVVH